MKNKFILTLFGIVLFSTLINAQNQTADWIRVQSDNGEFSIEVPAEYGFFADKDGFSVSFNSGTYFLQQMKMLNAFREKTLISVESYRANKSALDIIRERDNFRKEGESSEIKRGDFRIKQIVMRNNGVYSVRQYFNSKNYVYILTAASRNSETPTLRRFLDSLIFKFTDSKTNQATPSEPQVKTVLISALKLTAIEIDTNLKPLPKPDNSAKDLAVPTTKVENSQPVVILYKPPPSFTEAARMTREQGVIRLRLDFSRDGYISKIAILNSLKEGLLRQGVFAALRIKFLPQEKDGEPQTVTKVVEYSFDIY
ncbi:MAG: energy transducer TonB [Acidobacteria bacterium]|nr:energy transducer TonB [Acidobacteriota bacterium]MCA1638240.1 energy transducer TonB [Acidobacteriota bacterium]